MTATPIDERTAWALVRAVQPGSVPPGERVRVEARGAALEIDVAGAWTASAEVTEAAADLLDLYLPVRLPGELVIGQLGQSLDGRIATETGASHFVTGPEDIERLHRLRALVDAVVVGVGTVASDDPQLTVRRVEGANPVRVVLDPSGRTPAGSRVRSDDAARTILVRRAAPGATDVVVREEGLLVPADPAGQLDLHALVWALRSQGLRRILVEGGGLTVSRFLEAGLLDRLHVAVAPLLIGSGRPSLTLPPVASLDMAIRPACRHFRMGADVLFDLDLRAPRR